MTTDEQKTIYALGLNIAQSLSVFDLTPAEMDILKRALSDSLAKKPAVELSEWGPKIDGLARARAAKVAEHSKAESAAYLTKAATEPGAVKCDSGRSIRKSRRALEPRPRPQTRSRCTIAARWSMARSSIVRTSAMSRRSSRAERRHPVLDREGVQRMKVGGKRRCVDLPQQHRVRRQRTPRNSRRRDVGIPDRTARNRAREVEITSRRSSCPPGWIVFPDVNLDRHIARMRPSAGMRTLTQRESPATAPGAAPAYCTSAGWPSISTLTGSFGTGSVLLAICPSMPPGVVWPSPVA